MPDVEDEIVAAVNELREPCHHWVRTLAFPVRGGALGEVLEHRKAQGLTVDANFIGVSELALVAAAFDPATDIGEMTVRFLGELTSVVRNAEGQVIEGSDGKTKRQRDIWTFARKMGTGDPNWQLVATDE